MKIINEAQSLVLLRVGVAVIMMAHGFQRLYYGTVGNFGDFLNDKGFFVGLLLAWAITLFELTAGAAMALGYFVRWICLCWMVVIVMGIILVHAKHGWYVVGPSSGGVEYSVLLLICLTVLAAREWRK